MTGLTAATFGLKDRGVVRAGAYADLTVFDAGTVDEAATFAKPIQPARGIDTVIVNGAIVWPAAGRPARGRAGCSRGKRRARRGAPAGPPPADRIRRSVSTGNSVGPIRAARLS